MTVAHQRDTHVLFLCALERKCFVGHCCALWKHSNAYDKSSQSVAVGTVKMRHTTRQTAWHTQYSNAYRGPFAPIRCWRLANILVSTCAPRRVIGRSQVNQNARLQPCVAIDHHFYIVQPQDVFNIHENGRNRSNQILFYQHAYSNEAPIVVTHSTLHQT